MNGLCASLRFIFPMKTALIKAPRKGRSQTITEGYLVHPFDKQFMAITGKPTCWGQ